MALIYEPRVFGKDAGVRAAMSLRGSRRLPYGFNMSLSVGDDEAFVRRNRGQLVQRLGFEPSRLALQRQVHGAAVVEVTEGYAPCESDALMTAEPGWLLGVSVADCVPILLFDPRRRAVAVVHSGWRGTLRGIARATIERMRESFFTDPSDVRAYVGAAASQCCYEVGDDVASAFDARHSRPIGGGKYLFDNKGCVLEQLISCGLQPHHVELDIRCTICGPSFHSYRRDGKQSGRMLAVIGMNTDTAKPDRLNTA